MRLKAFVLMTVVALLAAACGGGAEDDTTTTTVGAADTTTTAGSEPGTTMGDGTDTTAAGAADGGVSVADSELGEILVDPDGFTLYVFTQDEGGESVCYDDCAENWPAVDASTPISSDLDQAMFGSAPRTDGTEQLTINGMPLYRFANDANPGDVNGQGANGVWFVVDPDGNMIEAAVGEDVAFDYDY
jgi:predicted lipoprotein with Yx(FWY)xxD motif